MNLNGQLSLYSFNSVSYTHLDVYKRQQVYRALGMDKPEAVAKVCYAQMVKQFLSRRCV